MINENKLQAMRDQELNKYLSDSEIISDLGQTCHEQQIELAEKEKEIERLRKIVIKVAEIAHMEAQDEFGLSWDDFKLNILYYRFEIMTDEEVNS